MAKHDSDILSVLPTPSSPARWMTTPDVRKRLEESGIAVAHTKTVQRRLEALEQLGVVNCRDTGHALEWQRKDGASGIAAKAGALMTFDEALALQVLTRFSSNQLPELVGGGLNALISVAKDRLSKGASNEGRRHAKWDHKIAVVDGAFKLTRPKIKPHVFKAVSNALFNERLLDIVYHSKTQSGTEPKKQKVMPLGLVEAGEIVYLVAKLPDKPRGVMYRLERMEKATISDEGFQYPGDFSLASYVNEEKMFDYFPQGEIEVALRFEKGAAITVLEAPLTPGQEVEEHKDGRITVRATVTMSERLRWWLRSFGPMVEVLEPEALRQEFIEEAKAMHRLYAGRRA
jgi:predicted DNA-binding transcriptional regulator YafY